MHVNSVVPDSLRPRGLCGRPPGLSDLGISQARKLEWVVISSRPRYLPDLGIKPASPYVSYIGRWILYCLNHSALYQIPSYFLRRVDLNFSSLLPSAKLTSLHRYLFSSQSLTGTVSDSMYKAATLNELLAFTVHGWFIYQEEVNVNILFDVGKIKWLPTGCEPVKLLSRIDSLQFHGL